MKGLVISQLSFR